MKKSTQELSDRYLDFARREAHSVSKTYERFATSVSGNSELLDRLLDLPPGKQQPNLLLAAARHALGLPVEGGDFARHALDAWDEISPIMLSRSTQTNEPGRCACLLPVLSQFQQPLAIIEVGASAGLCLIPERYGYDYGRAQLSPTNVDAPVFPCKVSNQTPIPSRFPEIVWRAGIDLNPLDVCDDEDMRWLKTLVWPEQTERLSRLEAAIAIAKHDPPHVVRGDLLGETEALASKAPADARLVIFHSAVLAYVCRSVRDDFAALVKDLGAEWLSNEGARVLPQVTSASKLEDQSGAFVLSLNGRALARTGPHGQFLNWL